MFKKIQYFSQTEFDQFSTSSLITRTNNDITQVQTFINMFLRVCLMAPFMCIGGIVMALAKSKTMSMILVVSMPVMFLFIIIIGKYSIPLSKKMQEKVDEINHVIREKLTGLRVARAFGTEEYESERFDRVNTDFMNNTINMNTLMGVMIPGLNLILYATTVALIYFGGHQIANTTSGIPIGDVIAVIQYVMQIMMSVMMLSMIFVMYPRASTSATRINEVLDTELAIKSKENAIVESDKKGYLKFQNVSFTFPKAASPALENISFESKPGEVTAIIGSTGSGKSTLINLIPRFYDVMEGEILVDDINVKDFDVEALRRKIGLVPNATDEEVIKAAELARADAFIRTLPGGYNCMLQESATNLAQGEKQLLTIARAILSDSAIMILDEATSSVDTRTEVLIQQAMENLMKGRTSFVIAHRLSTIKDADMIIYMQEGDIKEVGTHNDLLKEDGLYAALYNSQFAENNAS